MESVSNAVYSCSAGTCNFSSGTPVLGYTGSVSAPGGRYFNGNYDASEPCPVVGTGYWSPSYNTTIGGVNYYSYLRYACPTGYTDTSSALSVSMRECRSNVASISDSHCGAGASYYTYVTGITGGTPNCSDSNTCTFTNPAVTTESGVSVSPNAGYYYSGNPTAGDPCPPVGYGYWSPANTRERVECPKAEGDYFMTDYTTATTTSADASDCYTLENLSELDGQCASGQRKVSVPGAPFDGYEDYWGCSVGNDCWIQALEEGDISASFYNNTYIDVDYGMHESMVYEPYVHVYSAYGTVSPASKNYYDPSALVAGSNDICRPCPCITDSDNQQVCGTALSGVSGITSCAISGGNFADGKGTWEYETNCQYSE